MKILLLFNSFKGTYSSLELNEYFYRYLLRKGFETDYINISDGGDGFLDCFARDCGVLRKKVTGPFYERKLFSNYCFKNNDFFILSGMFFSLLPDLIKIFYFTPLRNNKLYLDYLKFHSRNEGDTTLLKGLMIQAITFILFLIILLISFLFVLAVTIGVSAESVRQIGRFIPKEISLKKLYEGSFLGLCTAVALLFVTRGDWLNSLDEWGGIIKLIAILFYLVLVLPLKLITFWIPASVLLAISAPIGAIIGYNLSPYAEKKTDKDLIDNESRSNNFVEEVK